MLITVDADSAVVPSRRRSGTSPGGGGLRPGVIPAPVVVSVPVAVVSVPV
ncbi:hypothetical protein [Streptomyces bullii]|uniref:Uncharacterized protein n=1 Tax=Streptomyces bullii TaxID=349910 RepID=A0ABW0UJ44_9ACTN